MNLEEALAVARELPNAPVGRPAVLRLSLSDSFKPVQSVESLEDSDCGCIGPEFLCLLQLAAISPGLDDQRNEERGWGVQAELLPERHRSIRSLKTVLRAAPQRAELLPCHRCFQYAIDQCPGATSQNGSLLWVCCGPPCSESWCISSSRVVRRVLTRSLGNQECKLQIDVG